MRLVIPDNKQIHGAITSKQALLLFVALWWIQHTVLSFATPILRAIPVIGAVGEYVIPIIMLMILLMAVPCIAKQLHYSDILFYLAMVALVFGTMLFMPENEKYIQKSLWPILGLSVSVYFLGVSFDLDSNKKALFWCSMCSVVLMYAYQLYQLALNRDLSTDNMYASYNVLPSVMYLIYWALEKKKLRYWVVPIVGVILVFSYGTRGPIVAILAFVLLSAFLQYFWMKKGIQRVAYAVLSGTILIVVSMTNIILKVAEILNDWFVAIGFSTRIMDLFIQGEIAYDSGRDVISDKITNAIWKNPILGYGIMGDRRVLVAGEGEYAHNILLEFWCDFGLVIGTVLIVLVFYLIIAAIAKEKKNRLFVLMISTIVISKLMFSGSFIVEPYFFLMLGLCVRTLRNAGKLED